MSHENAMPPPARTRKKLKRVTYTLNVTCEKIPEMNEADFLAEVRRRINMPRQHLDGTESKPITTQGGLPRVSVIKRIEEFGGEQ